MFLEAISITVNTSEALLESYSWPKKLSVNFLSNLLAYPFLLWLSQFWYQWTVDYLLIGMAFTSIWLALNLWQQCKLGIFFSSLNLVFGAAFLYILWS